MSAAPQFTSLEQIRIGTSTAAPSKRPVPRPAPEKKSKLGSFIAIGSVWMLFMFLCFALVQKNAGIRAVNADIGRARGEIAQLGQANLALEGQIANQVSVAQVQKWALAHNMQPPSGVVQTLQGKQEAVAVRHSPAPTTTRVQATQENRSFWQALLSRLNGSESQAAAR